MRLRDFFSSAIHFFFLVFLFSLALVFLILPKIPYLWSRFSASLIERPAVFSLIGFFLLIAGVVLFFGFYFLHRGQYYVLRVLPHPASVHVSLLQRALNYYWQESFPYFAIESDIFLLRKGKIAIVAKLDKLSFAEQELVLEKAEREIRQMLQEHFGYNKDFTLSILLKYTQTT